MPRNEPRPSEHEWLIFKCSLLTQHQMRNAKVSLITNEGSIVYPANVVFLSWLIHFLPSVTTYTGRHVSRLRIKILKNVRFLFLFDLIRQSRLQNDKNSFVGSFIIYFKMAFFFCSMMIAVRKVIQADNTFPPSPICILLWIILIIMK